MGGSTRLTQLVGCRDLNLEVAGSIPPWGNFGRWGFRRQLRCSFCGNLLGCPRYALALISSPEDAALTKLTSPAEMEIIQVQLQRHDLEKLNGPEIPTANCNRESIVSRCGPCAPCSECGIACLLAC